MNNVSFPSPASLEFPVEPYKVTGHRFGDRVRSRVILWARHLGDDVILNAETPVTAIGKGRVVWAEMRPGNANQRNWGGIIIIGHQHKETDEVFFSLYGHLKDVAVTVGQEVEAGHTVGKVAPGATPENGGWNIPHVHFAIYTGPWMETILPGYARPFEGRTKFSWWRNPKKFVTEYNRQSTLAPGSPAAQAKQHGTGS